MTLTAQTPTAFAAPMICPRVAVRPEWIDYNNHMNMAYYAMVFDWGADHVGISIGIGPDYIKTRNLSTMTLQASIWYRREVVLGDELEVRAQMIGHDAKRFHLWLDMYQVKDGYLAAQSEQAYAHVDLAARKSAPFPADILANFDRLAKAHAHLPKPELSGRGVSLAKR